MINNNRGDTLIEIKKRVIELNVDFDFSKLTKESALSSLDEMYEWIKREIDDYYDEEE